MDESRDLFGAKTARASNLTQSAHINKDGINTLDDTLVGYDMATGDPDKACYARMGNVPHSYRRGF